MTRFFKTAAKILGIAFGAIVLALAVAYAAGTVWVDVQEKKPGGHRVVLAVPSALVTLGLKFIPLADLRAAEREWRDWLPAVEAAAVELERCPEAQLIKVKGPAESLSIAKRRGSIVVDVDDAENHAHVSFPITLLCSVTKMLRDCDGPN